MADVKGGANDQRARVAAVVSEHGRTLLQVARQSSLCEDDALDAYQRGLEIFVRRVATVDPTTEVAWLKVVIRHEAMAIRRTRSHLVASDELDLDAFAPAGESSIEEELARSERVQRSAEALRGLKPDEATALIMKAHGLSYAEIGARNGWTYTKVNRAITEGRRRFMSIFQGIESGVECQRFTPIVEALAVGTASAAQLRAIRPHLRHCSSCRKAVRDLHLSWLRRASLFMPFLSVAARWWRLVPQSRQETIATDATDAPIPEGVGTGVAASEADLIGPSAAEQPPVAADAYIGHVHSLKHNVYALLHRASASDVATGVQIGVSTGGNRVATVATVLGICVSGAGVGTACVVSELLTDPRDRLVSKPSRGHAERTASQPKVGGTRAHGQRSPASAVASSSAAVLTPALASRGTRETRVARRSRESTRERRSESPTLRTAADDEFGFERTASRWASSSVPAGSSAGPASPTSAQSAAQAAPETDGADETDPAQQEFGP